MGTQLYTKYRLNDVEIYQLNRNEKFKVSHSAGKVVLTVFWDAKCVLLIDFFTSGTINAGRYCDTLIKLMSVIQRKRPGLLSGRTLFLVDNARSITSTDTKENISRLG
ncbi:hypothetical protein AVEN_30893-1 [Araneus ventricosus]|uniref:Mariner Mos1 transposase n=1 Tax=Araneus ventricosus TaxID=182803 RepID=A0A4Y2ND17_ARAVE|nr:hypothetical protein AVEN_30893-1 [Araneus ventricosus]